MPVPILLLIASSVFMTFAGYDPLNVEHRAIWLIVLTSWGIVFFEHCLAIPADRIGWAIYDPAELKAVQEVITLGVFAVFSVIWLKAPFTMNHAVGFGLIGPGAVFIFKGPFN